MRNSMEYVVKVRVNITIYKKNLFYSHFSRSVFLCLSLLPPLSLLFLPFFLQRLLKGNESTHPLSFIISDAGLCLLSGQLPAPNMWKGKLIEIKIKKKKEESTPSIHLLTACS